MIPSILTVKQSFQLSPNIVIDEQLSGLYSSCSSWHHAHRFVSKNANSVVEDRIEYFPLLNLIGIIANKFYIKKK